MNETSVILVGVLMFTLIVLLLVLVIILAKSKLVAKGNAKIIINGDPSKSVEVPFGGKLLNALAEREIFIPSACGGGGTCGECKLVIEKGGGEILPT
ncbi:MAG: 2Fe-2S iron-sulfur cluster binding domain-containing protein, partial [Chlorobi bacterium]|nr:2Fe-2S iron-sulfur cluster binding domain-containing protein [Chlorobiota bacterium]